jgi:hypothetical protein
VATGRTGLDFSQSLLGSHTQILHFTGTWFFLPWWQGAKYKNNVNDLINEFIWFNRPTCNHITKFKSYYKTEERWEKLGDAKNDYFEVNIDAFRTYMINIFLIENLIVTTFFISKSYFIVDLVPL